MLESDYPDSLFSRRVVMRPISRDDYPLLFKWRSDVSSLHLWSTHRRVISFEQFAGGLEQLLQEVVFFLILDRTSRRPIGFVHTYGASPEDGFVHFLLYADPSVRGTGITVEGSMLFGDYLFKFFAIRKLYAEVYQFNQASIDALESAGFSREGTLREHIWYLDRYWDLYQYALYRSDWEQLRTRMRKVIDGERLEPTIELGNRRSSV
ncbi:MAG: GNAT family protein [Dehalococcoidia bacterium]